MNMLNKYLEKGAVPKRMTDIKPTLIHKKNNPNSCDNYRRIALINTITKLLTNKVNNRLQIWTESYKILLPEAQSGFRKKRSCIDNLFVINAIIKS